MTSKAQVTKGKYIIWTLKFKKIKHQRTLPKKVKRNLKNGRKCLQIIYLIYILVSRICKNHDHSTTMTSQFKNR